MGRQTNPSLKAGVSGYMSYRGFSPDGTEIWSCSCYLLSIPKLFLTIDIFKKPNGYKFLLSERRRGKEEAWVFITLKLVRNIKSGVLVANPKSSLGQALNPQRSKIHLRKVGKGVVALSS